MSKELIGTYLNDHLAGSVLAVETIERVLGAEREAPLAASLSRLLKDIEADQDVVRGLLKKLEVNENPIKKAGAWLAEKAGRVKLSEGALGRLEILETLALGIQGKLKLWQALERVAPRHSELAGVDYQLLQQRAREQHERLELHRQEAAIEAFG